MKQKYTVYIGGKPLVFENGPLTGTHSGMKSHEVRDEKTIHLLIDAMNAGNYPEGIAVRSAEGFDPWNSFRSAYKFVQAAGGLVVDEQGRLLAIRRLGVWDLPKGKVEKGEAIDVGAVREVQEECGLHAVELVKPVTRTWHTYERKGKQHLKCTEWFLMRASSKEKLIAQLEEDIEEVRWMDAEGVRRMEADTYPSLLPVLEAWRTLQL